MRIRTALAVCLLALVALPVFADEAPKKDDFWGDLLDGE